MKLSIFLTLFTLALADESNSRYLDGEHVLLWLNKIGPYANSHETYEYYHLPFCKPDKIEDQPGHKVPHLGEVIEGTKYKNSGLHIEFARDTSQTVVCSQVLSEHDVECFKDALFEDYYYQLYLDHLPILGKVGEITQYSIYTDKELTISYNLDRIIHVTLKSGNLKPLEPGQRLDFSYSVRWIPTTESFETRFDRYLEEDFYEHSIHYFAILNSIMMVLFLSGLVVLILVRTIKSDYAKYNIDETELPTLGDSAADDSGWKLVHGDVFRYPRSLALYVAMVGTGVQLIFLVPLVIVLALAAKAYMMNGLVTKTWVIGYVLTSVVNGFVSGSLFRQFSRNSKSDRLKKSWKRAMILSSALLPIFTCAVGLIVNAVAVYHGTINTVTITTMLTLMASYLFVIMPLHVAGTVLGRNACGKVDFPCRVNTLPRHDVPVPLYLNPTVLCLLTGVLPFGSIFIEMYFVFSSFWSYKVYYVYGFMLLVYAILSIVTLCSSIVSTYVLLNSENWRWIWHSFLSAGSTALYVFLYAIYYFHFKTNMSGVIQTSFYFGYTILFCFSFFLFSGAVGFFGSYVFVRRIYRDIKTD